AGEGFSIESDEPRASAVAESAMVSRILDRTRRELLDWLAREDRDKDAADDITTPGQGGRRVTDEEAGELSPAVSEAWDKYPRTSTDERPPGARRVQVTFVVVPTDKP